MQTKTCQKSSGGQTFPIMLKVPLKIILIASLLLFGCAAPQSSVNTQNDIQEEVSKSKKGPYFKMLSLSQNDKSLTKEKLETLKELDPEDCESLTKALHPALLPDETSGFSHIASCAGVQKYFSTINEVSYSHYDSYGPLTLAWGKKSSDKGHLLVLVDGVTRHQVAAVYTDTEKYVSATSNHLAARETLKTYLASYKKFTCPKITSMLTLDPNTSMFKGSLDANAMCERLKGSAIFTALKTENIDDIHILAETNHGAFYGIPLKELYLIVHVSKKQNENTTKGVAPIIYKIQDQYLAKS